MKFCFSIIAVEASTVLILLFFSLIAFQLIDGIDFLASPLPSPMKSPGRTPRGPCCVALYDFVPENPGELGFKVCICSGRARRSTTCFFRKMT